MKQHLKTLVDLYLLFSSIQSVSTIDFVFNCGYGVLGSGILSLNTYSSTPIYLYTLQRLSQRKQIYLFPFQHLSYFLRTMELSRFDMVFLFVPHLQGTSSNDHDTSYLNNNAFRIEFNDIYDISNVEIYSCSIDQCLVIKQDIGMKSRLSRL